MLQRSSGQKIYILNKELISQTLQQAQQSPRKRSNANIHVSMDDNPHRFFNVLLKNTYIAPHRHLKNPKAETFIVLSGQIQFFIFNDNGSIKESYLLGESDHSNNQGFGIDILPGIWHTLIARSDEAICFEVKPGPYKADLDKEFASWAPTEDQNYESYLQWLYSQT